MTRAPIYASSLISPCRCRCFAYTPGALINKPHMFSMLHAAKEFPAADASNFRVGFNNFKRNEYDGGLGGCFSSIATRLIRYFTPFPLPALYLPPVPCSPSRSAYHTHPTPLFPACLPHAYQTSILCLFSVNIDYVRRFPSISRWAF